MTTIYSLDQKEYDEEFLAGKLHSAALSKPNYKHGPIAWLVDIWEISEEEAKNVFNFWWRTTVELACEASGGAVFRTNDYTQQFIKVASDDMLLEIGTVIPVHPSQVFQFDDWNSYLIHTDLHTCGFMS